jgi:p21-activated kinase 1
MFVNLEKDHDNEDVSLLDFLGEISTPKKPSSGNRGDETGSEDFRNEEKDLEIFDFLQDLKVGKNQITKILISASDDTTGPVSSWSKIMQDCEITKEENENVEDEKPLRTVRSDGSLAKEETCEKARRSSLLDKSRLRIKVRRVSAKRKTTEIHNNRIDASPMGDKEKLHPKYGRKSAIVPSSAVKTPLLSPRTPKEQDNHKTPNEKDNHRTPKDLDYHKTPKDLDYHKTPKDLDYHKIPKDLDYHKTPKDQDNHIERINTTPYKPERPKEETQKEIETKKDNCEFLNLLDFLGELKDSPAVTEKTTRAKHYDQLPEKVRERCKILNLEPRTLQKYSELIWRISYFLYKEDFPSGYRSQMNVRKESSKRNTTAGIVEIGRTEIRTVPTKTLKKLFKMGNLTGEGGFAKVFVCRDNIRKETVAIKKLNHKDKNKEKNWAEVGFLCSCTHDNIVAFYGAYLYTSAKNDIEEVWIVNEYVKGGTLSSAVKYYNFQNNQVAFIVKEVLKALQYIHGKNFAHRDLKSTNIMLTRTGGVKLIDFGLCADMSTGDKTKLLGSPYWISPEMINKKPHNVSVDIWSLAVSILEVFLRAPPYSSSPLLCMFTVAVMGLKHMIPENLTEPAKDFLKSCLEIDPTKRPTANDLLEHDWLKGKLVSRIEFSSICHSIFISSTLEFMQI